MTPRPVVERAPEADRTAELAGQLRTVVNRLAFHLRKPAARHGITPTRLSALTALAAGGPRRIGDLGTQLGITAASMSRLTEALQAAHWVRREPDPEDQRACLLALTDHGAATLDGLRREGTGRLARDIAALSDTQQGALASALPVLVALADKRLDASSEP
ncbi:MAG: MarR family winged helix-turn-helix transcriptional regulator [Sciscionella sp.]